MHKRIFSLACTLSLLPACFSPATDADFAAEGETEMEDVGPDEGETAADAGETGGTDGGDSGVDTSDDDLPDEGGSTGGDEPAEETTGEDPSGTTGEDPVGSTGEVEDCDQLGTDDNCLACGDTCEGDATCYPEGCLSATLLGFPEAFNNIGGVDGFLYGFPIEVQSDALLTHFGFIAAGQGAGIQMALYSDLDGLPDAMVAESDALQSYETGEYELEVMMTALPAGTYWLMANLGSPRRIAADLNGGQVNFPVAGIVHEFGNPLPDVIADPSPFVNFRPNFFIEVLE